MARVSAPCAGALLRGLALVSCFVLISSPPVSALPTVELDLVVAPTRVEVDDHVTVTVSGAASCPRLVRTTASFGVAEIHYSGVCANLPPDPGEFTLTTTLQLTRPGVWEVRLIDIDAPESPGALAATAEVTVIDPDFSISFTPSPANTGDHIRVAVAGIVSCFFEAGSHLELSPGRIRILLQSLGYGCGAPRPPAVPFAIDWSVGSLEPGAYLAEVFLNDVLVTDTTLLVGPGVTSNLRLEVEPTRTTTTEPLVVAVRGVSSCPEIVEHRVSGSFVEFVYRSSCPTLPPDPFEFALFTLIEPLPAGIWEFRLVDLDIPVSIYPIVQAIDVTVTDPDFAVQIMPSPALEFDLIAAKLTGLGGCLLPPTVDIEPGRVEIRLDSVCDEPRFEPFELLPTVGHLRAGDYLAEFYYDGRRVADTTFEVLAERPSCLPSSTALCLNQGRFRVEATWTTAGGDSGSAMAVPETDDTGLFWFFDENNVEMVVKVLDGCDTTIPNFWVFAAGLTDVGVRVTVTDTETGRFVVYETTPGQTFEPITDTAAFDICPDP